MRAREKILGAAVDWFGLETMAPCDTLTAMNAQLRSAAVQFFSGYGRRMLNVLMPPLCPVSGEAVAAPGLLSAVGWRSIQFIEAPFCNCCGVPFAVAYGADVLCPSCIAAPPAFDRARAAIVYDDASHRLVVGFKHSDRTEHAEMLGAWMSRAGAEIADSASLFVPVPLHRRRLLSRRDNQSNLLAAVVARRLGGCFAPDLLERRKSTPPQKNLSAEARERNVAGAFRMRRGASADGAHVVLIDDVHTTGATLSAAARALKKAGAARVDALVLARVVKGGVGAI
jgi:ComF family protein